MRVKLSRKRGSVGVGALAAIAVALGGSLSLGATAAYANGGTITANGPTVVATISAPGTPAAFTFSGTSGEVVTASAFKGNFAGGCDVNLEILASSGAVVANGGCAGVSTFIGETPLPGAGTYTLELVPNNTDLGSVTLALSADAANGTIKVNGSTVTFTSSHTGQGRNFAFTGKARQVITVSASRGSFPGGCDVTMELVDSVGNVLGNGGCAGSNTFIGETTLPSAASYLIELIPSGSDPGANVGSLKLNVSADPANGSITANGAAVTFTATHTGQGQNFSFTGQAGQVVTATTSNGSFPGGCDLTLLLVDSSGNTLGNGGCAASNTFIGETTLPSAGTYTLKLLPTGSDAGNNTGHLTLNLSADPANSTITPDGPAVTFTATHTGQGQNFTFSGTANEVVNLTASNGTFPSGCDLTMLIVSPSGSTVANGGCSAQTSTITGAVLPGTGTYAVELLPTGSNPGNNTGSVTLKLTTGGHRSR